MPVHHKRFMYCVLIRTRGESIQEYSLNVFLSKTEENHCDLLWSVGIDFGCYYVK